MSRTPGEARYTFSVEWFDHHAGLARVFNLMYFELDDTIEMFDVKNRKNFLKRTKPPEAVKLADLFVGAEVTVYSRRLKVLGYADALTTEKFRLWRSSTAAIVKPDGVRHIGTILNAIESAGLRASKLRSMRLSGDQLRGLLRKGESKVGEADVRHMASGVVIAMEIAGHDAVASVHDVLGPRDPADARAAVPGSLRARLARDSVENVMYASATQEDAARDIKFLFGIRHPPTALYRNVSVLTIKPHAVTAGKAGDILNDVVAAGFAINSLRSVMLEAQDASDYMGVYRGVVREYASWVKELSSGLSIIVEVSSDDVVARLRALAGAFEPEVARTLMPDSLRSKYGKDSVRNAVHVTDLPLDGPLESKFLNHVVA